MQLGHPWETSEDFADLVKQKRTFETAKSRITAADLLIHFDPDKKLILPCDASPYGLGAVLS